MKSKLQAIGCVFIFLAVADWLDDYGIFGRFEMLIIGIVLVIASILADDDDAQTGLARAS